MKKQKSYQVSFAVLENDSPVLSIQSLMKILMHWDGYEIHGDGGPKDNFTIFGRENFVSINFCGKTYDDALDKAIKKFEKTFPNIKAAKVDNKYRTYKHRTIFDEWKPSKKP